jgi:hypothetical protein
VNSNLSLVPLQQASLCLDCETITTAYTNCLGCGSRALLSLARVLSQHSTDLSSRANTTPVPISFPRRQRHTFHPAEPNVEPRRLERVEASPLRFAIGMARNRHETFES